MYLSFSGVSCVVRLKTSVFRVIPLCSVHERKRAGIGMTVLYFSNRMSGMFSTNVCDGYCF